jgi:hypothetical protein
LVNESFDSARRMAKDWMSRFPNRYYLELQRDGQPECDSHVAHAIVLENSPEIAKFCNLVLGLGKIAQ